MSGALLGHCSGSYPLSSLDHYHPLLHRHLTYNTYIQSAAFVASGYWQDNQLYLFCTSIFFLSGAIRILRMFSGLDGCRGRSEGGVEVGDGGRVGMWMGWG